MLARGVKQSHPSRHWEHEVIISSLPVFARVHGAWRSRSPLLRRNLTTQTNTPRHARHKRPPSVIRSENRARRPRRGRPRGEEHTATPMAGLGRRAIRPTIRGKVLVWGLVKAAAEALLVQEMQVSAGERITVGVKGTFRGRAPKASMGIVAARAARVRVQDFSMRWVSQSRDGPILEPCIPSLTCQLAEDLWPVS